MVRRVLHDFTFVSNLFHYIGNPSRVKKSVSVVGGERADPYRPPLAFHCCLHTLALQYGIASANETATVIGVKVGLHDAVFYGFPYKLRPNRKSRLTCSHQNFKPSRIAHADLEIGAQSRRPRTSRHYMITVKGFIAASLNASTVQDECQRTLWTRKEVLG